MSEDESLLEMGELIWVRIPGIAAQRFLSLGVALADGSWLRAWPPVAVVAPAVALGLGGLLGLLRPDPTFTRSLLVLSVLVALAGVGAGIGTWTWAGYVAADLAFHRRTEAFFSFGARADLFERVWHLYVPRLLTYLLLAVVLVMMPVAATGIRLQMVRLLRLSGDAATAVAAAVQGLSFAVGVGLWAQATAFMIRPLWSFVDLRPDIRAIAPLQEHAVLLGAVGGVVAAVRVVVAASAFRRVRGQPGPALGAAWSPWPWWVGVPVRAVLLTLLLAGVIAGWVQGVLVFLVMLAACAGRAVILPQLTAYVTLVDRVPLLLRLALVGAIGWALSGVIVQPAVERGEASFSWMLVAIVASTLLAAALIPPADRAPTRPARPRP